MLNAIILATTLFTNAGQTLDVNNTWSLEFSTDEYISISQCKEQQHTMFNAHCYREYDNGGNKITLIDVDTGKVLHIDSLN